MMTRDQIKFKFFLLLTFLFLLLLLLHNYKRITLTLKKAVQLLWNRRVDRVK